MTDCKKLKIKVPKNVCTIQFGEDKQVHTIEYHTCRKELMLLHLNHKNEIVEIELISDDKPCQKTTKKKIG
jgi:hypothetical protein